MSKKNSGFILVTGLIFLLVLSLTMINTMQTSTIDYKLSSNEAFAEKAFQASETGRVAAGATVADYVFAREWDDISVPSQLTVLDKDSDGILDAPTENNGGSEDLLDMTTLVKDMEYDATGSSTIEAISADIYINQTQTVIDSGSGAQMMSGYEGLGKGSGAGGGVVYFELRSIGTDSGGAKRITASEYRARVQ